MSRTASVRAKKTLALLPKYKGEFYPAMKEAGFSEGYARNPQKFKKTLLGSDLIKNIDNEIGELWKRAGKTRKKAKYRDIIKSIDTLERLKMKADDRDKEKDFSEVESLELTIKQILRK